MITWPMSCTSDVSVLFIVLDVGTWVCNALMHSFLHAVEVSRYWSSKPMCWVVDVVL
jgi:hypothetical protein